MIGLVGIAAFTFIGSYALYYIANMIEPMRVTKEEEELGLDITQHGESYQTLRIDL
jgi:Amt family ammonium transporter